MTMQDDDADRMLLRKQPQELLIKYQPIFSTIVRKYAQSGYYPFEECEEMLQHLNGLLLSRIDTIFSYYDGRVLVKTYLSVICHNALKEYIRCRHRRNILLQKHLATEPQVCYPEEINIIIREECKRLDKVMLLMGEQKNKLWLMMKLLYRIRVEWEDLLAVNPKARAIITEDEMNRFNSDAFLKDKDIYRIIFPLVNRSDGRTTHPDTLRKWFDARCREVVALMNGSPARAAYSSDTLQYLMEKYCALVDEGIHEIPVYDANQIRDTQKARKTIRMLLRKL